MGSSYFRLFAKMYHRMKMDYDLGLSRIYELVINSDPYYAFLLDSNTLVQIDESVLQVDDPMVDLRPMFYLAPRTYGVIEQSRQTSS